MKNLFSIIIILFLVSCGTQYQATSWTGGYSETQLGENMFKVYFQGNGYTSSQKAADMCLLRCAEICIEKGYKYFAIIDASEKTTQSSFTTPIQTHTTGTVNYYGGNTLYGSSNSFTTGGQTFLVSKPSANNTIVMLNEKQKEGITYDAKFLYESLGKKYIPQEEETVDVDQKLNPCGKKPKEPVSFGNPNYKTTYKYRTYKKALIEWEKCNSSR
tara:strand:- start:370 stop:1014 length:645 start_codon:yes stop_codon:yes gene_type:complete